MNTIKYTIRDDKNKIKSTDVQKLLRQSYWANERSIETVEKSMKNAYCFGVFEADTLVGFGRVVSDFATVYWVCDIIVDANHRGQGLGKAIMSHIVNHPDYKELRGILATADAHGLYEQYGFEKEATRFMSKKRVAVLDYN